MSGTTSMTEKYAEMGRVTTTSGTGAVASTGALSTGYKNNDISSKRSVNFKNHIK